MVIYHILIHRWSWYVKKIMLRTCFHKNKKNNLNSKECNVVFIESHHMSTVKLILNVRRPPPFILPLVRLSPEPVFTYVVPWRKYLNIHKGSASYVSKLIFLLNYSPWHLNSFLLRSFNGLRFPLSLRACCVYSCARFSVFPKRD
jgi:hypothetical protein